MNRIFEGIIALTIIVGAVIGAENWLAKASDVDQLNIIVQLDANRLQYHIIGDQIFQIEKRVTYLEEKKRNDPGKWSLSDNDELLRLKRDLKEKNTQLRIIEEKEIK